jgi:hypothetical protein
MTPFQVRAVNTATDSDNRIHDDTTAAEYGFQGGLVPGVTIYGYMATAVIDRLGPQWLARGAMDVRFTEPFYEGEQVAITITDLPDEKIKIEAGARASGTAWIGDSPMEDFPPEHSAPQHEAKNETIRPGMLLATLEKTLDLSHQGVSAPLDAFIGPDRFAHPAIILGLANEVMMHNYALGPWIHASSEVRNASQVRDGEQVQVRAKIVDAYERKGHEFVVLDVAVLTKDRWIARIRHTAIWRPRKR